MKTKTDLYTSDFILNADDLYPLQDSFCSCGVPFKYKMTKGEIGYANFVKGKYEIADFILDNMDENGILSFTCPFEFSKALENDGMSHKAVMLSDDTALQKLFFWLNIND